MLTVSEYFNVSKEDLNKLWDSKISREENILFRHLDNVNENKQKIIKSNSK